MDSDNKIASSKALARALESRDAAEYMRASTNLGITPEDEYLVERYEADLIFSRRNKEKEIHEDISSEERTYWEKVTETALRRFPELQPGENIGVCEIRRRLKAIRETGYEVKSYSKLNKNEVWELLRKIRSDVADKARVYCPGVLERITARNENAKRDAEEFR